MMKGKQSVWLAVFCLVAVISLAGNARAQMTYTELGGGGGGGSIMRNPNHIDFVLQYNHQLDNDSTVKDGGGFWLGYRRSLMENLSLGGKFGAHSYNVESTGFKDTVTAVPLLFTAQVERNFDHVFNLFAQLGMGPSFNSIRGDLTDALDIKLDTSFAFDVDFGGTFEINPNIAVGINFDWFLSSAHVTTNLAGIDDHINLSHFGVGIVFVGSF